MPSVHPGNWTHRNIYPKKAGTLQTNLNTNANVLPLQFLVFQVLRPLLGLPWKTSIRASTQEANSPTSHVELIKRIIRTYNVAFKTKRTSFTLEQQSSCQKKTKEFTHSRQIRTTYTSTNSSGNSRYTLKDRRKMRIVGLWLLHLTSKSVWALECVLGIWGNLIRSNDCGHCTPTEDITLILAKRGLCKKEKSSYNLGLLD